MGLERNLCCLWSGCLSRWSSPTIWDPRGGFCCPKPRLSSINLHPHRPSGLQGILKPKKWEGGLSWEGLLDGPPAGTPRPRRGPRRLSLWLWPQEASGGLRRPEHSSHWVTAQVHQPWRGGPSWVSPESKGQGGRIPELSRDPLHRRS